MHVAQLATQVKQTSGSHIYHITALGTWKLGEIKKETPAAVVVAAAKQRAEEANTAKMDELVKDLQVCVTAVKRRLQEAVHYAVSDTDSLSKLGNSMDVLKAVDLVKLQKASKKLDLFKRKNTVSRHFISKILRVVSIHEFIT